MMGTHTPAALHTPQRALRLVCGYCGGNIVVESCSAEQRVRCPSCLHRVKMGRIASHECEYADGHSRAGVASGSMDATRAERGRSYTTTPVMAPTLRHHRHGHRGSHPRSGADPAVILLVAAIVILYLLVKLSLVWFGSGA